MKFIGRHFRFLNKVPHNAFMTGVSTFVGLKRMEKNFSNAKYTWSELKGTKTISDARDFIEKECYANKMQMDFILYSLAPKTCRKQTPFRFIMTHKNAFSPLYHDKKKIISRAS